MEAIEPRRSRKLTGEASEADVGETESSGLEVAPVDMVITATTRCRGVDRRLC